MPSPAGSLANRSRRTALVAAVGANALPLIGVVAFGWTVAALILVYWFELAVRFVLAAVRALFAGRPSEFDRSVLLAGALADRSLSLDVPGIDAQIRLSSLPAVVVAAPLLAALWFVVGAVTVGLVGGDITDQTAGTVVLATAGILVTGLARTGINYFYRGGYREHSAQTALQGPFVRGVGLFLAGFVTAIFVVPAAGIPSPEDGGGSQVAGAIVLVAIVLAKFGFDLAAIYRDRLVAIDEATNAELGLAYEPPTPTAIETALSGSVTRLRPDLRWRLIGGIENYYRYPRAILLTLFTAVVGTLLALDGVWTVAAVVFAVGVAGPVLVLSVDHWLRYWGVEYRVGDDAIVAADRLFGEPLWRVEPWDEIALRVERDGLDRLLDTRTVVIELPDSEARRVFRLPDPEPALAAFDRRADRPED